MSVYAKINAPFKRHTSGPDKGKLIMGEWCDPLFEYLADNEWEFSEKVDGTNIRVYLRRVGLGTDMESLDVRYRGRTDNADIPIPLLAHLEEAFPTFPGWRRDISRPGYEKRNTEILNWMQENDLERVALYGEGYGPKIQNGGNYRKDVSFVLFDVKIGDYWLSRDNVNDVAEKLGIDSVPLIGFGTLSDAIALVQGDTRRRVTLWDEEEGVFDKRYIPGPLKSEWGDFEAEGIIARPTAQLFNAKGERITTKVKSVDFR